MSEFERVCAVSDVPPGTAKRVAINGTPIAIFNIEGTFYATADRCTHARASLSDGFLDGFLIECPLHQGSFDVRTGQAVAPPCKRPLQVYSVSIRGEDVCLRELALSNA
jgi:nitrite reductase/ring-hydroxylating ferredoxin subunit